MALEALKIVRQAEDAAREERQKAQNQAKAIAAETQEKAKRLILQEIQAAEKEAERLKKAKESGVSVEIEKKRALVQQECEQIRKQAEGKLNQAVNLVMERIVKSYGHR